MGKENTEIVLGPQRGTSPVLPDGELRQLQDRTFPDWWSNPRPADFPDNLLPLYIVRAGSRKEAEVALALAPSCVRAEVYYPSPVREDSPWSRVLSVSAVGFGSMALVLASATTEQSNAFAIAGVVGSMIGMWKLSGLQVEFQYNPAPWMRAFLR